MPAEQIQVSEELIFDGTFNAATAVVVGIALAGVTAWLLWRDRHAIGPIWACVFFGLRLTAVVMVMWMLAGPMREAIRRSTTPQSIAILADVSASMDAIDVLDPPTALRWQLATTTEGEDAALTHCDQAQVAVGVASHSCQAARQMLAEHRPLREVGQALDRLNIAVSHVKEHCIAMTSQMSGYRDDFAQRIERIENLLSGPIEHSLELLSDSLDSSLNIESDELFVPLENLNEHLLGIRHRIDSLARDMAEDLAQQLDEGTELTRREQTVRALERLDSSLSDKMAEEVRIRRFHFDERVTLLSGQQTWNDEKTAVDSTPVETHGIPAVPPTNIAEVLEQLSREQVAESTRLAVLLSDGHHNDYDAANPQEVAAQLTELPVYVVPVGSSRILRDVRIHRVEAPKKVVEKDTALIEAIVTAYDCDGMSTDVVLRHDGQEIDRQIVEFFGERVDRRIQFRVTAEEIGWQEYELAIEPLEEESTENNVARVSWQVIHDKIRILLADGISRWEYRYLQQLFRRDRHIEFDELLFFPRLRGTGELAVRPRLPEQADDWSVYDVVILGDIDSRLFSPASQESLVEYVREQQGNLILIAGSDYMPHAYAGKPLVDLLPVENDPNLIRAEAHSLVLTDEGRQHSALAITDSVRESERLWREVYYNKPVHGLSTYSRPKPTARTLLSAIPVVDAFAEDDLPEEDQPAFLCWQQVGGGRVAYLAAPETWKLRFRRGDREHHRFWGQLIRWITASNLGTGSELVKLSTDQTRYNMGEVIEVTAWLKDQTGRPLAGQDVEVLARSFDQDLATIPLESDERIAGRYFGVLKGLSPGTYEIVLEGAAVQELLASAEEPTESCMITIEKNAHVELLDTRSNLALLEQIAHITGGQVAPPTAISEILQLASLSPEVKETVRRTPLWSSWKNLWIVLGCLFFEWIVRKQKGLV
ncbi:MAG: hypothetical protein MI725_06010 [Pirellulales bacterium]|nr:hypothetical protein [Pirellulales bacterium]